MGLSNITLNAWAEGRTNGDYSILNKNILDAEPELELESEKVKDLIIIKKEGNVLDVLARILRHELYKMEKEVGRTNFVNFFNKKKIKWQHIKVKSKSKSLSKYKSALYTAYNWLGIQ